ncbi:hypothetical protein J2808_001584 [Pseudarthrobacter sulfonivorans]|nr:hypothetical protein [Pseudarthrobacter sulfonivorans]
MALGTFLLGRSTTGTNGLTGGRSKEPILGAIGWRTVNTKVLGALATGRFLADGALPRSPAPGQIGELHRLSESDRGLGHKKGST